MGADLAYVGSAFIATKEANAPQGYKDTIVEARANDIVYSNLFTGVHGNYLRQSIVRAGLDPENLPVSDPSAMNFGSGGNQEAKAWRDIWGSGQGVGAIDAVLTAGELIAKFAEQYEDAKAELAAKTALTSGSRLAFAAQ
jgi:nitronate monooxygenase